METDEELKELETNLNEMFPKEEPKQKGFLKDKEGNKLTFKQFFKKWGEGIKNLTIEQRMINEARGTLINLIGFVVCLVAIIIFHDKFIVSWFAYGLILVFVGSIITTGLKWLSIRQQLRIMKNIQINILEEKWT